MQEVVGREPPPVNTTIEKEPWISEDWLAVWVGLFIFADKRRVTKIWGLVCWAAHQSIARERRRDVKFHHFFGASAPVEGALHGINTGPNVEPIGSGL